MEINTLRIPDFEKGNVRELVELLHLAAQNLGHRIQTEVVGGATQKPWPRKDIDLLCTIIDLKGKLKGNALDRANQELDTLLEITSKAISTSNRFRIYEIIRPYMDHGFENPNILEFRGVIRISPNRGVPIEIIGGLDQNW